MQKVAAYCRVSTDKEDQANSLDSQKKYFREYIGRNPEWELSDIYVDEGITGTSTKKRIRFNRMIADAQIHKFDMIVTKEISRFARNTLDSIYYTRKLKELGIGVFFVNDNINTLDPDAELRLTIMSSIAQEESRKTSERVKWGQKRRMEQGVVFGRDMLGYDIKQGKMFINPEGAETVRLIFHMFVSEGKGCFTIAKELREAGIKTLRGNVNWSNAMIFKILRNEKYAGDLIQKKTYTPSYLNHEKKYNRGQEEFITIRDHHEAIISREVFEKANHELNRRSPGAEQKVRYTNRYCFSGKIKCGYCGKTFVPRTKKRKDGSVYRAWRCAEASAHGKPHTDKAGNRIGCDGRHIGDEDLMMVMSKVVENLNLDRKTMIGNLTGIVKSVFQMDDPDADIETLNKKRQKMIDKKLGLMELYLGREISKEDFLILKDKLENDIKSIENEIRRKTSSAEILKNQTKVLEDISETIRGLVSGELLDPVFYRSLLNKIIVYDGKTVDVYLDLLPNIFKFSLSDTPVSDGPCAPGESRDKFASSVPMSLSVALACGVTIENL